MSPIRNFALFSLLSICIGAQAQIAGIDDPSCPHDPQDKYDVPTRIQTPSKFAGQCVDSQRFRPALVIQESAEFLKFANYRHMDKYWTAHLNKNARIEKVYFQLVKFKAVSGVTAAHSQYRVVFAKERPLKLTSQVGSEETSVSDLVVSYEASRPADAPYNFAVGAFDHYLSVPRLLSSAQRLIETENITEQYEIQFPEVDDAMELVLSSIRQSSREKYTRFYNTLKPNCTTEVFDRIDELDSMKKKGTPAFLAVISNDPVAGPSIAALKERGLFIKRVANLRDQVEKGINEAPPTEEIKQTEFLANIPGLPYALVFVAPENLNAAELKIVRKAQKMAYELTPKLLNSLGSAMMLGEADLRSILAQALEGLNSELQQGLKALNKDLPTEALNLVLYLTPWDSSGQLVNPLADLKRPARLPIPSYEVSPDRLPEISEFIHEASAHRAPEDLGFQLKALALQMNLMRDASSAKLQVLAGISPRSAEFSVENKQVKIQKMLIPEGPQDINALFELTHEFNKAPSDLMVEFGNFETIKTLSHYPKSIGQLRIKKRLACEVQAAATPQLKGVFNKEATGLGRTGIIDRILDGRNVNFQIFGLSLDLKTQQVSSIDVRIKTDILFECFSHQSVNDSFLENINSKIEEINIPDRLLESIISNNPKGQLPGLE